jgi:hypothetical protein
VSKVSYINSISETIISVSGTNSNYQLNYNLGSIFFLTTVPNSVMTVQLYNLPSITDSTRSYVISVIFPGQYNSNFYVNNLYVNTGSADLSNSFIPHFTNVPSVSTVTSGQLIIQQFIYLYQTINGTSTGYVLSNINTYTN